MTILRGDDADSPEDFEKPPTVPLTRSTPKDRREDVDFVLRTGCEAANKDKFDTPADDLKVLDQFFPRSSRPKATKSQRTEPRALRVSSVG